MSIDLYQSGSFSYTDVCQPITLQELVGSTQNARYEMRPGMKIVLEEKYLVGPGVKYDTNRYSFWIGDATPFHEPSDNDGGFGWCSEFMEEYGEWEVVEIWSY